MIAKIKKMHAIIAICVAMVLVVGVAITTNVFAGSTVSTLPDGVSAEVTQVGGWESNGYTYYQLQLTIKNGQASQINDWEFDLELPEGATISQDWCGKGVIKDNHLYVTPLDYNKTIYPNSDMVYGCIIYSKNAYAKTYEAVKLDGKTYVLTGKGQVTTTEATSENTTEITTEDKTESTTENTSEATTDNDNSNLPSGITYSINQTGNWQSGNEYFYQLQLVIDNNSSVNVNNWSFDLNIPGKASFSQGWCANYKLNNNTLTITPFDYNSTISVNNKIENVGFIISTTKEVTNFSGVLTVDGKKYEASEKVTEATPEATTEATTEKATESTTESTTQAPTTPSTTPSTPSNGSPVATHGKLSVKGTSIVDKNGKTFQLRGVSTHGLAWFPQYDNKEAFSSWKDFGGNVIRLAMYSDKGAGFSTSNYQLIYDGVDYATELGMYVIIDWHILSDGNPNTNKADAINFFKTMSARYANYDNVIYEICNEPNGCSWASDIKPYAEDIIDIIRANDKDAIIIVGTPTWSQDVDEVSNNPITGETNIVYALHFYAATHTDWIRNKAQTAINNGLPLFVSEFGMCDASGNGGNNFDEASKWISFLDSNNISYVCWNLSNKSETSALISSSCSKTGNFTLSDLSESGKWFANILTERK